MRLRRWLLALPLGGVVLALLAATTLCLTSGCSSVGYLAQSATGHLALVGAAKPVPEWLADEQTPAALKQRLAQSQEMRAFAVSELKLPDNDSYRRYADLKRPAAVWNVVAAPELSLTLKTWCFPVVGCVSYRGYFDEAAAQAEAAALRAQGWEASVYPVPAYSTLGMSDWLGGDPLLNTFIQWPEAELARMIFHELSHQVVFIKGDTTFNESYATAVERLGGERWLQQHGSADALARHRALDERRADMRALTAKTRARLQALYSGPDSDAIKRERKAAVMTEMRAEFEQLKRERWGGFAGYDAFFARANNATLGMQAAYLQWVPAFEALFAKEGRDFARFHAAVARLGALTPAEREAALKALSPTDNF
ncbi:aminopeptidase [Ideonella paludis]|uniref:Aminopeptidase n=1 Tax=Ideonella paludis TaxID=1233411 RepID=A0ABS5E2C9_9BURK|nr:aminopeptidase [Ideonella paludis]MBQ0937469.1 aminopeptidase [Ideonella paludis]